MGAPSCRSCFRSLAVPTTTAPCACRLGLGGGSLLHWTTFLPLCARLEVLDIKLAHGLEEENEHLLCSHLW